MATTGAVLELLLVDASPGDIRFTQEIIKECPFPINLSVVHDGEAALAFLRRQSGYHAAPRPAAVLVDLYLPEKDGLAVIAEMKEDPALQAFPVIVLLTAAYEQLVIGPLQHCLAGVLMKPVDADELGALVCKLRPEALH